MTRYSPCSRDSMVSLDEFARFMWILVTDSDLLRRDIYITVVCYFPSMSFHFSIHSYFAGDPYMDL